MEFSGCRFAQNAKSSPFNDTVHSEQNNIARVYVLRKGRKLRSVISELWPNAVDTMSAVTCLMNDESVLQETNGRTRRYEHKSFRSELKNLSNDNLSIEDLLDCVAQEDTIVLLPDVPECGERELEDISSCAIRSN